jgi:zinc/manganese transport system substrate-binding protein
MLSTNLASIPRKRRLGVALALPAFLYLAAAQAALNVVVTTPDLTSIAKEIGGSRVELTTLARPSEDLHFVEAKPSFVVKLNRADALIEGGAELELGWLPPLLEGARNPKLAIGQPGRIVCNRGLQMLEVPQSADRSQGDLHALGNPHYTTDPFNGRRIAETIAEAFCKLDPASAESYRANLKLFQGRLDARLAEWQTLLAPCKGRHVVTYHNYWPYFSARFGLQMDIFLEPKPGIPPSAAHLTEVVRLMKEQKIKVVMVQPYVSRRSADTVARLSGATVVEVAAQPGAKGTESYLDWLDSVVRALAKALGAR